MPKKILSGKDIAEFIEERHFRTIRSLRPKPKLAIIRVGSNAVSDVYIRVKQKYADDIGADVEVILSELDTLSLYIDRLNKRSDVHGIILQLPLPNHADPTEYLNAISLSKDVDGLRVESPFDPATPQAILWLLAGYNIDLLGKKILIVGQGRLVGAPLTLMLRSSSLDVQIADDTTKDLQEICLGADLIISATGRPGLIQSEMVPIGATVVDAGTASEDGMIVGDVAEEVRAREDVVITPLKGGVGPLTVSALFENLIKAYHLQS